MIPIGPWRWPLVVGIPLIAGALLVWRGVVPLNFEGKAFMIFAGKSDQLDDELKMFQVHPVLKARVDKVPGDPRRLSIRVDGRWPSEVLEQLKSAAQGCVDSSFTRKKIELDRLRTEYQKNRVELEAQYNQLIRG